MQIDIIPLGISERPARQLADWHDPLSKVSRTYHMGLEAETIENFDGYLQV